MPSSFSSWPSDEHSSPKAWNGERPHDERDDENAPASSVSTTDASLRELREELAVARRRLQYYEGFAPWIEEQMAGVVERAAEVAGESEREQARLAEEIERRNAEVERLTGERDRLREEARTIVAEANSAAEGVIDAASATAQTVISDANNRAASMLADARRSAETMVGRLRDEAAEIVGRALGDLSALEARNAEALQAITRTPFDEPATTVAASEPDGADSAGEWQSLSDSDGHDAGWSSEPALDPPEAASGAQASAPDELSTAPATDAGASTHQALPAMPVVEDEPPVAPDAAQAPNAYEASAEASSDPGPFQWLRTALAGRDGSAHKDASDGDNAAGGDAIDEETFVTRLVIHPAFTPDERRQLQQRIGDFAGVQHASPGSINDDFFELFVTHEVFTSMLGSLLTAAGEHIRLFAQHDDSLEIEVTGLEWTREGAEAVRGFDS